MNGEGLYQFSKMDTFTLWRSHEAGLVQEKWADLGKWGNPANQVAPRSIGLENQNPKRKNRNTFNFRSSCSHFRFFCLFSRKKSTHRKWTEKFGSRKQTVDSSARERTLLNIPERRRLENDFYRNAHAQMCLKRYAQPFELMANELINRKLGWIRRQNLRSISSLGVKFGYIFKMFDSKLAKEYFLMNDRFLLAAAIN